MSIIIVSIRQSHPYPPTTADDIIGTQTYVKGQINIIKEHLPWQSGTCRHSVNVRRKRRKDEREMLLNLETTDEDEQVEVEVEVKDHHRCRCRAIFSECQVG